MHSFSVVLSLLALFALAFAGESKHFSFVVDVPVSSSNYAMAGPQEIPALNSTLSFKGTYTEKLFVCFNLAAPVPTPTADEDLESVCNPDNFFTLKSNTTENYDFWVLDDNNLGASLEGEFNSRVGRYYMGFQLNSNNITEPFVVTFEGNACLEAGAVGPNCEVPPKITSAVGMVPDNSALTFEVGLEPLPTQVGVATVAVANPTPSLLEGALAKNETRYTLWVRANNAPSPDAYDNKVSGNSTDLTLKFEASANYKYYAILADSNGSAFNYSINVDFASCSNNTMGKNCDVVVRDVPSQDLKTSYQTPDKTGMTYFKFVASTVVFGVAAGESNTTQATTMGHKAAPSVYVGVGVLPTEDLNVGYIHGPEETHVYVGSTPDGTPGTWIFGVESGKNFTVWAGVNPAVTCANDCSGNGVCNKDGSCSCTEEWSGFDCSMVEGSASASTSGSGSVSASTHSSTNGHTHTSSHSSTNGHTHSTVSTSASSSSSSGGGGLKKIYIVLIVIAAVIVLAILIGVPVACYVNHRKRLQYERV